MKLRYHSRIIIALIAAVYHLILIKVGAKISWFVNTNSPLR